MLRSHADEGIPADFRNASCEFPSKRNVLLLPWISKVHSHFWAAHCEIKSSNKETFKSLLSWRFYYNSSKLQAMSRHIWRFRFVYVHIVSLPTDPYVLSFAEWTFPQPILCLINSLEQLHFQQCFIKTLHYSEYTQHRQHLAFCVEKNGFDDSAVYSVHLNKRWNIVKQKCMFNAILHYS